MLQDADPWIHPWTFPPGDWENSPHKWWWKEVFSVSWGKICLDVVSWIRNVSVIFYGLYHGIYHRFWPPFGRMFLVHFFQASKSRKSKWFRFRNYCYFAQIHPRLLNLQCYPPVGRRIFQSSCLDHLLGRLDYRLLSTKCSFRNQQRTATRCHFCWTPSES